MIWCLFGMFSYKKGLFSDRPKPRIFRSGGSTLGSIGVGIPPFEFPIFSIYTKIRFCRFFLNFFCAKFWGSYSCFRHKSAALHDYFKNNFRLEQMYSECRKMHHFACRFWKISGGSLHIRASGPQRTSDFVGPLLSKVAGSAPCVNVSIRSIYTGIWCQIGVKMTSRRRSGRGADVYPS